MADTKISDLTSGTAPEDADQFAVARSTSNRKLTWANLKAALSSLYATAAQGVKADGAAQIAGDLAGTPAAPTVAKISGVAVSGTPSSGQVLTATSGTAAQWSPVSGDGLTLSNYREALGNITTSADITLTLDDPVQRIVLDAVRQITAPADPGAVGASLTLILLCQTYTPTWSGITWLTTGGVAPTLNTDTGKRNVITLIWDDAAGGSGTWLGFHAGSES